MVEVTVIIPIHNSERYLKECIESALSQSFSCLEILCIDGGSTDVSNEIIRKLQKQDDRIISIQDKNTSYGHKINVGIEKARGKYFTILESDDRMEWDMIERLYQIAEKYDTDIIDANYYEFLNYNGKELRSISCKYSNSEDYNRLMNNEDGLNQSIITTGIWTGLYKKSFIVQENIWLNESAGASYQDLSFLFLASLLAKRVYHVDTPLYQYRVDNPGSSVKDESKVFEIIGECAFLKNNLINRGIQDKNAWKLYYTRKYKAFYWNYRRLSHKARAMFLERYIEELEQDIKTSAIDRKMFEPSLYNCTFLLIDDKEKFFDTADRNLTHSFLQRACRGLEIIAGHGVVLFGSGGVGTRLLDILTQNNINILGICDNSQARQGIVFRGFKILSVKESIRKFPNSLYFIASRKYADDMLMQLLENGIKRENIIVLE